MAAVTEESPEAPPLRGIRRIPLEIRKVATVLAIAIVLASSFAAAYTVALGRPPPAEPARRSHRVDGRHRTVRESVAHQPQ